MDRKVVIVSPTQDTEPFERVLKADENNKPERHVVGYREFLIKNGLEYKGYEKEAAYTLAMYLISLGCICFDAEPTDVSVVYLPERITNNQYLWWKKAKKNLRRYKLAIIDKTEIGIDHYDECTLCGEKPFTKLKNLIEDKEIVIDEKEVKKCIKK